jgi:ribosomal protein L12E/L44/L45/RPP1/RPP2
MKKVYSEEFLTFLKEIEEPNDIQLIIIELVNYDLALNIAGEQLNEEALQLIQTCIEIQKEKYQILAKNMNDVEYDKLGAAAKMILKQINNSQAEWTKTYLEDKFDGLEATLKFRKLKGIYGTLPPIDDLLGDEEALMEFLSR